MKHLSIGATWVAVAAFAFLLVAGGAAAAAVSFDHEGEVVKYEAGKSIEIKEGEKSNSYKIDEKTKVEGEVAVGKKVKITAKDGLATKIEVKK